MLLKKLCLFLFCITFSGCSLSSPDKTTPSTVNSSPISISSGQSTAVKYDYPWWWLRPHYKLVKNFVWGIWPVIDYENRVGVVNIKWEIIIPFGKYKKLDDSYDESWFIWWKDSDNHCVLINSLWKEVLKRGGCTYLWDVHEWVFVFHESSDISTWIYSEKFWLQSIDWIVLVKDMRYIDDLHDWMIAFSSDFDSRVEDIKVWFLDSSWRIVIDPKYDFGSNAFSGWYAAVSKNGLFWVIDKQDNTVIDFKYDYISDFYWEFAFAGKDGTCWKLDLKWRYYEFSWISWICTFEYAWSSIWILRIPSETKSLLANKIVVNINWERIVPWLYSNIDVDDTWITTRKYNTIEEIADAESVIYNHSWEIVLKIPWIVGEYGTYFYWSWYYYYADWYRVKE